VKEFTPLQIVREAFLFVRAHMNNLTPEFFDTLIVVIILVGLALAAVRLYRDFTRPLPPEDDTRPIKPRR
jgi:hypothetical protein